MKLHFSVFYVNFIHNYKSRMKFSSFECACAFASEAALKHQFALEEPSTICDVGDNLRLN